MLRLFFPKHGIAAVRDFVPVEGGKIVLQLAARAAPIAGVEGDALANVVASEKGRRRGRIRRRRAERKHRCLHGARQRGDNDEIERKALLFPHGRENAGEAGDGALFAVGTLNAGRGVRRGDALVVLCAADEVALRRLANGAQEALGEEIARRRVVAIERRAEVPHRGARGAHGCACAACFPTQRLHLVAAVDAARWQRTRRVVALRQDRAPQREGLRQRSSRRVGETRGGGA